MNNKNNKIKNEITIQSHSLFLCKEKNLKINILRAILIIALIGTFSIIFGFSNQNSKVSGGTSQKIAEYIVKHIPSIQELDQNQKVKETDKIEKIIRKIAHFSIYTLVGFLLMSLASTYKIKELDQIGISLIIGVIYASTDEIHQAFIPGRGPLLTDVILDSMGVLTGIYISMLLITIINKVRETMRTIST